MGVDLLDIKNQAVKMADILMKTSSFIVNARLWDGFFRQRLVIMVSLLAAIIIPYSVYELAKSKITSSEVVDSSRQSLAAMHNAVSWSSLFDSQRIVQITNKSNCCFCEKLGD